MNRVYEVMFIVRPDATEEDQDKLIEGFTGTVTGGNGEVTAVEKLGRRRLAYTVRKFNDGIYILLTVAADAPLPAPHGRSSGAESTRTRLTAARVVCRARAQRICRACRLRSWSKFVVAVELCRL